MSNRTMDILKGILWDELEALSAGDSTAQKAQEISKQVAAFISALNNGDKHAIELSQLINSGEVAHDDAIALLTKHMASMS